MTTSTIVPDADSEKRLRVPHVMIELIMTQQMHNLPDATDIHVNGDNGIISLTLATEAALRSWLEVLAPLDNTFQRTVRSQLYDRDGVPHTLFNGSTDRWSWHFQLSALVPVDDSPEPVSELTTDDLRDWLTGDISAAEAVAILQPDDPALLAETWLDAVTKPEPDWSDPASHATQVGQTADGLRYEYRCACGETADGFRSRQAALDEAGRHVTDVSGRAWTAKPSVAWRQFDEQPSTEAGIAPESGTAVA